MSNISFHERKETSESLYPYTTPFHQDEKDVFFPFSRYFIPMSKMYHTLGSSISPFIDVLNKDVFTSSYAHRAWKVCMCLGTHPIYGKHLLKGLLVHRRNSIRESSPNIEKAYPILGKSLIKMSSVFLRHLRVERFFPRTFLNNTTKRYKVMGESPLKIGFPYYAFLEYTMSISCRERLIRQINQIFLDVHKGSTRSEYSHENSSPVLFLRSGFYSTFFPTACLYPWALQPPSFPFFKMNCYGFVWVVVSSIYTDAAQELKTKMEELSHTEGIPTSCDGTPCPFNLAAIFKQSDLKYWERISKLEDIQPGDIVVYLPPNHHASSEPSDWRQPTGTHVMFVRLKEKKKGEGIHLSIIDSTRQPHCPEDSRFPKRTGIGKAPLTLLPKDEDKGIYLIQWGSNKKQKLKHVVVGRMVKTKSSGGS